MQDVIQTGIVEGRLLLYGMLLLLFVLIAILIFAWRKIHLLFISAYNREIKNIMATKNVSEAEAKAIYSEQRKAAEKSVMGMRMRRSLPAKYLPVVFILMIVYLIAMYYTGNL